MTTGSEPASQWGALTAQQLVRFEALFRLLDSIRILEDIAAIAKHTARQWKYFANVDSWRIVTPQDGGFLVIDGDHGQSHLHETPTLDQWDEQFWTLQSPRLIRRLDLSRAAPPPIHLARDSIAEIQVLPFTRESRRIGMLSAGASRDPFTELDIKFIRLFGSHVMDHISSIVLRRQATEALIAKATRDPLTGLLNRGAILERLESQLAMSDRTGEPLSVIMADIDFFKGINDRRGHLVGDEVLREVTRRMLRQTRASDVLGRYGGDEFLFVLFPCGADDVMEAATRFRQAVTEAPIPVGDEAAPALDVTISLGAASTTGRSDVDVEGLLKLADEALYCSKAGGRNQATENRWPEADGTTTPIGIRDQLATHRGDSGR